MNISNQELQSLTAYLDSIEREENVTVVAAWVMGSHARGVSDSESDIDIQYIFVEPLLNYISLTKHNDSLRHAEEDLTSGVPYAFQREGVDLEFMGWNARRFLELLGDRDDGNNPAALECLCSPYTLRTHPVIEELREYVDGHYNVIELSNHYTGLVKRNWRRYLEEEKDPSVKRLLYIVRGVLYARYVREQQDLPPMDIPEFLSVAPDSVFDGFGKKHVSELVEKKQSGRGGETVDPDTYAESIERFLAEDIEYQHLIRENSIEASVLDEYMFQLVRDSRM